MTTLHHDTVARIYVSVAIVFIKKKPRSIDGKVKLIVISLMIKTKNYSEILKKCCNVVRKREKEIIPYFFHALRKLSSTTSFAFTNNSRVSAKSQKRCVIV